MEQTGLAAPSLDGQASLASEGPLQSSQAGTDVVCQCSQRDALTGPRQQSVCQRTGTRIGRQQQLQVDGHSARVGGVIHT